MKKNVLTILTLSLVASVTFAQTGIVPPTPADYGRNGLEMKLCNSDSKEGMYNIVKATKGASNNVLCLEVTNKSEKTVNAKINVVDTLASSDGNIGCKLDSAQSDIQTTVDVSNNSATLATDQTMKFELPIMLSETNTGSVMGCVTSMIVEQEQPAVTGSSMRTQTRVAKLIAITPVEQTGTMEPTPAMGANKNYLYIALGVLVVAIGGYFAFAKK